MQKDSIRRYVLEVIGRWTHLFKGCRISEIKAVKGKLKGISLK